MKVATFTLHGTMQQSIRWKQAAEVEGFASVGSWAALALDAYLKARARAGRPLPLSWSLGRFPVLLDSGETVSLRGWASPPLFIFRGNLFSGWTRNTKHFTLIHQPDGKLIATLRTHAQARQLAAELAPLLLRGKLPDPAPIVDRHVRENACTTELNKIHAAPRLDGPVKIPVDPRVRINGNSA
jgi:hypothetical protein